MTVNHENDGGDAGDGRKRLDMAGVAFKAVLLALVLGIGYFLMKPIWDELFQPHQNPSKQQMGEDDSHYDPDGGS
jgi:hypothetical protein